MDFADLAGDASVDLAGEALRPGFAGVPSARDFAMAEDIESNSCPLVKCETRRSKENGIA